LVAAALAALPLIAQAGQGLIKTVSQDISSFLGGASSASTGQNVPASANTPSVASAAQTLSSDMLSVLSSAQTSLGNVASFASGQSGVSKQQLEGAASSVASFLGQSPTAATSAADQVFSALDPGGTGQVSGPQLANYLSQVQSQAASKYQAAGALTNGYLQQAASLLTSTGLTA
jgi:type IV secretory pathway VirJ component